MNDTATPDRPLPAALAGAAAAAARAQRIRCGPLEVAVPYTWARGVVEDATLVSVPNAPPWLAGAANVEGRIVAVIDLQAWVDPTAPVPAEHSRLLLGGDGDDRLALRFQGLPQMVRLDGAGPAAASPATALKAPDTPTAAATAPLLAPYVIGSIGRAGEAAPLLDLPALARTWVAELAA